MNKKILDCKRLSINEELAYTKLINRTTITGLRNLAKFYVRQSGSSKTKAG